MTDNGPGIPGDRREDVVKRFVRLDESRSKPGTGLGLSLVQAVAALHGGSLQLRDGFAWGPGQSRPRRDHGAAGGEMNDTPGPGPLSALKDSPIRAPSAAAAKSVAADLKPLAGDHPEIAAVLGSDTPAREFLLAALAPVSIPA